MRSSMLVFFLAAGSAAGAPPAAQPCSGFKWDVTHEFALFAGPATELQAAKAPGSAPPISSDRLYELELSPQSEVAFEVPPGKRMITDGAYAGVLRFEVAKPGSYRVSVDVPFWIDVVGGGQLVATKDFQGQQRCAAPHKIVEYELAAARPYFLQVSAAAKSTVRLSITRSPAAAP